MSPAHLLETYGAGSVLTLALNVWASRTNRSLVDPPAAILATICLAAALVWPVWILVVVLGVVIEGGRR